MKLELLRTVTELISKSSKQLEDLFVDHVDILAILAVDWCSQGLREKSLVQMKALISNSTSEKLSKAAERVR